MSSLFKVHNTLRFRPGEGMAGFMFDVDDIDQLLPRDDVDANGGYVGVCHAELDAGTFGKLGVC
jgi:hypothetical protein